MVKHDPAVKLSNLVVACARKEIKDGGRYLKPYRVVLAYSREGMHFLLD